MLVLLGTANQTAGSHVEMFLPAEPAHGLPSEDALCFVLVPIECGAT